jgi:hypothetical protein
MLQYTLMFIPYRSTLTEWVDNGHTALSFIIAFSSRIHYYQYYQAYIQFNLTYI